MNILATNGSTALTIGSTAANNFSILDFEVGPGGASDQIAIGNNADLLVNLGGGQINITGLGGFGLGTYNLLTYGNGDATYTGSFSLGSTPGGPFTYTLGSTATSEYLSVTEPVPTAAYWRGNIDNFWSTQTGGGFNTNFATDVTGTAVSPEPGATTDVYFYTNNANLSNLNTALGQDYSIKGLIFLSSATSSMSIAGIPSGVVGESINTLTLGVDGITIQSGAGAVTISANVALGSAQTWTNNSANLLTVSGSVNNLNNTLVVAGSGNTTISGSVSGSGGLVVTGNGNVLKMSGANTFTGPVTVTSGTLQAGVASVANTSGAFGNNTAVTMANTAGATLDLNNFNTQIGSLTGGGAAGGNVTLRSGTLSIGGDNTSPAPYAGGISGSGGITKIGTGLLTLSGSSIYTGVTTLAGGVLNAGAGDTGVGSSATAGALGAGGAITFAGGTLQYSVASASTDYSSRIVNSTLGAISIDTNSQSVTYASALGSSNTGGLTKLGQGTLFLDGADLYTGTTTIAAGILNAGNATALGNAGPITFTDGILQYSAASAGTDWSNLIVSSTGAIAIDTNGQSVIYNNALAASNIAGLTKLGQGTLTLAAVNSYLGNTTIQSGTLAIAAPTDASGALGNVNGSVIFSTDGAGNFGTLQANGPANSPASRGFILNNFATINTNGNPVTINGAITGASSLTKTGAGTLSLTASNHYGTGVTIATVINGGTLSIINDNNLGVSGTAGSTVGEVSINNGATLSTSGSLTSNRIINLGPVTGTTPQNGGGAVSGIINVASGELTQIGQIFGTDPTSSLEVTGPGLLFLNNTTTTNPGGSLNSFSGGLYIHGGIVLTGNGPQFGNSLLTQDNGGTLISNQVGVFTANVYIGTGGGVRESGLGKDVFRNGPILNVTGENGGLTLQGDQTAVGGSAANAGKVGLGGINTFGGAGDAVTIGTNFTVSISQDANLGDAANVLNINGGTLAIEDGANFNNGVNTNVQATFATSRQINLSGASTILVSNTDDAVVYPGGLPGGNNIYPHGANVFTVNGLVTDGTASGSLTKTGPGTLVLTNSNTYTGVTSVGNGILSISNVATGLTPQALGENSLVTLGVAGISSGILEYTGGVGTLDKNITSLGTGGDTIWNNGSGLLSLTGTLTKNSTVLTLNGGPNGIAVYGPIIGAGGGSDLYINGGLTELFNSSSSYNGPTFIVGGGTLVGGTTNVLSAGTVLTTGSAGDGAVTNTFNLGGFNQTIAALDSVSNGSNSNFVTNSGTSTLTITGTDGNGNPANGSFGGVINDGGGQTSLTVAGGIETLTGMNTYSGATTITSGTLQVNGSLAAGSTVGVGTAATLSGTGTVNGNATLTGNGAINLGSTGSIGGTLGVTGGNWNGLGTVAGQVTSSSGNFNIGSGANLTASTGVNVTGGTISSTDSTGTITGSVNYTSSASSTFNGVIAGSGNTLTLNNPAAMLTLGGTNTYTGATTITSGTLVAGVTNALKNTASVTVNNTGTLMLGASGAINSAASVTLAGGTFNAQGNSQGSADPTPSTGAPTAGLGALTLSQSSTLDFGTSSSNSVIAFAASGAQSWNGTLTILDWNGVIGSPDTTPGAGQDALYIGSDNTSASLTGTQLGEIQFDIGNSVYGAGQAADGEIFALGTNPVPEPSTVFGAVALLSLVGYRERRRLVLLVRALKKTA